MSARTHHSWTSFSILLAGLATLSVPARYIARPATRYLVPDLGFRLLTMPPPWHRILAVLTLWMLCMLAPVRAGEIAVIVHPYNPVAAMSAREVSDLYLGRSRSFAGDDQNAPIAVYEQPPDSTLRENFFRSLNGMNLKQLNAYWARLRFSGEVLPPVILPDSRMVLEAVGRNRGGIGYVDAAVADASVKVVLRLKD